MNRRKESNDFSYQRPSSLDRDFNKNNSREHSRYAKEAIKRYFRDQYLPQPATQEEIKQKFINKKQKFSRQARKETVLSGPEIERNVTLGNPDLPSFQHKKEIIQAVSHNKVTIVVGETGCGKSTQVPQFLVEGGFDKIVMTQPRILASNGVAERIEQELVEFGGLDYHDAKEAVGIHTSELNTTDANTNIQVVTDGLRLAEELGNKFNNQQEPEVLIIDEVHEWNTNIEILVASVKKALEENPNRRLVIMSATMNADALANYFMDAIGNLPETIHIEGRTFPVEKEEKSHSDVVQESINNAKKDQTQLIFVPGEREIYNTIDKIEQNLPDYLARDLVILPLYSGLSKQDQDRIYRETPGKLKIVVATNIAQTSITIPNVDLVIDSGLERRKEYDDEDELGLELHTISKDDCDQRSGRTGRTAPGKYILTRLDENFEHVRYISRDKEAVPEILRTNLARNVLRTACYDTDFADLDLFHPVSQKSILTAKEKLYNLGAIDDNNEVTEIGRYMNQFPLDVALGRMMNESKHYSEEIVRAVSVIAAAIEAGKLQDFGYKSENNHTKLTDGETESDLIAQYNIFKQLWNLEREGDQKYFEHYLDEFDIDAKKYRRAKIQYQRISKVAKLPSEQINQDLEDLNLEEIKKIKKCIYAGMIDNVYEYRGIDEREKVFGRIGDKHSSSRSISNRSVVKNPTDTVTADPFHFTYPHDGDIKQKKVIENVTNITHPKELIDIESNVVYQKPVGEIQIKDGSVYQDYEYQINGKSLNVTESVKVELSKENYLQVAQELAGHMIKNMNRFQTVQELFALTKFSQELSDRDPSQQFRGFTESDLKNTLIDAAIRANATSTPEVEAVLWNLVQDKNIIEHKLGEKDIDAIEEASPLKISIQGREYDVDYLKGEPFVTDFGAEIRQNYFLNDGREIKFAVYEKSGKNKRKNLKFYSGSEVPGLV